MRCKNKHIFFQQSCTDTVGISAFQKECYLWESYLFHLLPLCYQSSCSQLCDSDHLFFLPFLTLLLLQDTDGINLYYWSLFDGHAGSGAAVVASKLLQHHILEQLQEIVDILRNTAVLPPTCLGEEPDNPSTNSRTLTRAASLRGGVGAPGSPSTPPTRFFTEKKIPHECLVIGAIESAFKEMVCMSQGSEVLVIHIESCDLEIVKI